MERSIRIEPDGRIVMIHDDAFVDLAAQGKTTIRRASHVEPDAMGQWWADLAPVGGPMLGPFVLRGDALKAETDWLTARLETGACVA